MEKLAREDHHLLSACSWIQELVNKHGIKNSDEHAQTIIQNAVGEKCEQVLKDAGVFKTDKQGRQAFNKFLASAGFTL